MEKRIARTALVAVGLALFLSSISCRTLFPRAVAPGSLEEQISEGNLRFEGSGNVTYIGCQDPTAVVSVLIGPKTNEHNGVKLNVFINPVTVNTITDGTQIKVGECSKTNHGEGYDWPAMGNYYPDEARIVFTNCTQSNHKAEGEAFLVGEGFEGDYACFDKDDGGLIFAVAFSAYSIVR